MKIKLNIEGFEERDLAYKSAGIFASPALILDNQIIKSVKGKFELLDNNNKAREITLKKSFFNFFDPIPVLIVDGQELILAEPLKWYHYIWLSWPIILVLGGGACGGALGAIAVLLNFIVFRSLNNKPLKYLCTAFISIAGIGIFFICAIIFAIISTYIH